MFLCMYYICKLKCFLFFQIPVELLPYLYIGDSSHSSRKDVLKNIGVTAILNVSTSCENHFPQDFRYKVIPVEDTVSADLLTWFTEAIDFIGELFLFAFYLILNPASTNRTLRNQYTFLIQNTLDLHMYLEILELLKYSQSFFAMFMSECFFYLGQNPKPASICFVH